MSDPSIRDALVHAAGALRKLNVRFALVGGLAVSVRGEVRTTRDVDVAVAVANDSEFEQSAASLREHGYRVIATVEQEAQRRLGTVRLASPSGFVVDLLGASCGIEVEIVSAALPLDFKGVGTIPVASAEDLLAMKLLSARPGRERDWGDARGLLQTNPQLDLNLVRERLRLIAARGFARREDLLAKLDNLLAELKAGD